MRDSDPCRSMKIGGWLWFLAVALSVRSVTSVVNRFWCRTGPRRPRNPRLPLFLA
jgi:hypothetical protein